MYTVTSATDRRLKAEGQSFSAQKGATSVNNVRYPCATPNTNQLVYSCPPPSPEAVMQKTVVQEVVGVFMLSFRAISATSRSINSPLMVWGGDCALARAAPLGQLTQAYNLIINNASVQAQVNPLQDLIHVLEGPAGRAGHGTTFRTPLTASWDDAAGTPWGLGSTADMQGVGDVPPGAFTFDYCLPNGDLLSATGTGTYIDSRGNTISYRGGIPYFTANLLTGATPPTYDVYIRMTLRDAVMCSPLSFSLEESWRETGMYGLTNLIVQQTLQTPAAARLFQCSSLMGIQMVDQNWAPQAPNRGILSTALWFTFLTPSYTTTLPPRSIVSLCNIQYFQQAQVIKTPVPTCDGAPLGQGTIMFPAVTFGNIPDLFIISVRPDPASQGAGCGWTESDWCCTYPDNPFPQFTFANQSGCFAGWPSYYLTLASKKNGSKASLSQYGGLDGSGYMMIGGRKTVAGGSVIVIRPNEELPLPVGTSNGSTGQVQMSFQINFNAPGSSAPGGRNFICTLTALTSAYFVTENGVSRPVTVSLDDATVLAAPEGPDRFMTSKLVGGGFFSSLGSFAKNALANKDQLSQIAQGVYSGIKNRDPSALMAAGAQAHGMYNASKGSAMAGGAYAGAGMRGGRPTLASRLQAAV